MSGSFRLPIMGSYSVAIPDDYERPPDWITLPSLVDGDQKVVMLHKVEDHDSNFCAFSAMGNYTVDWGDGTIQNYNTSVAATHIYNFNSLSSQTLTSFGYKQVIITITPQAGQDLTRLDLNIKYPTLNLQQYSTGILDVRMAGNKFRTIGIGGDTVTSGNSYIHHRNLELFEYIGSVSPLFNDANYMFQNCYSLAKIINLNTSNVTKCFSMFYNCYSLLSVPLFDLQLANNTSNMFRNCYSLTGVPLFNLQLVTNASSMFEYCESLKFVPNFNLINLVNATNMFYNCHSLTNVSEFTLGNMVNCTYMFGNCRSLEIAPFLDTSKVTDTTNMFTYCFLLKSVPLYDLSKVINATNMFLNCQSVTSFPLFDLQLLQNASNMFQGCLSAEFPLFNLQSVTNAVNMFQNCQRIIDMPFFNLQSVTNAVSMFQGCIGLKSVPAFNFQSLIDGSNMFNTCQAIESVSLITFTSAFKTATAMFNSCNSLREIPLLNLQSLTNGANMFSSTAISNFPLFNLQSLIDGTGMFASNSYMLNIPLFNLPSLTIGTNMFNSCSSLSYIPALNLQTMTIGNGMFMGCVSSGKFLATNISATIDLTSNKLSKTSLEGIFSSLSVVTSKSISIGGNWGADIVVSKSFCGTTIGSKTITQANTSSLAVGMYVSGTGISTPVAVTLQTGANTITLNNHGLIDGKLVYIQTLVTTTGLALKTPYYVVNATTNTFQVSSTLGGSALTLTNDGTGTIYYATVITAITTNSNFTVDMAASATGTVTLSSRYLNTTLAVGKGWTVGG